MSTSATTIKSSLLSELQTGMTSLAEVVGFAKDSFAQYPAGYLIYTGEESKERANTRRDTYFNFRFVISIEQGSNFEASKSERLAIELADELRTLINSNVTLNGSVLDVMPLSITASFESDEVDKRVLEATIRVRKLENITN